MRARIPREVFLGFLAVVLFGEFSTASAYEEAVVEGGGTLTGKATLKGSPPPARIFHLVFSPNFDFCGQISDGKGNRLLKEFQTSPDGGFQDVVIAVVGVSRGKKFDYTPEIQVDTCRITPTIAPVRNHHPIKLVNKDNIMHDIQGYTLEDEYTFAMFNKPMLPEFSATKEIRLREGHYLFRTQCGIHDFMQSWGIAVGNPYFALSKTDGGFTISDIPPGTYDVIAWHPRMKVQAKSVTVPANGRVDIQFEFDAKEVNIPLHDLQNEYRLQPALDARHLLAPTVELQKP